MRLRDPRVWVGTLSLLLVGWLALAAIGRTSPGPLSSVHGAVAELEGRHHCAQCHGGWFASMKDACLACHEPIATQFERGSGLHGTLPAEQRSACASCHSEHHGAGFAIVNRASFALAAVPDPAAFDHARIGWEMSGKHLELSCAECHVHAEKPVLADGEQRYLGLARDCASCHEDPHDGRMQRACADCHDQSDFAAPRALDHERVLALGGGHAAVTCRGCHADGTAHALELLAPHRPPAARSCAACHDSPHRAASLAAWAGLARTQQAQTCVQCHDVAHEAFGVGRATIAPEQHAASGFTLGVPHDRVACDACHRGELGGFAERHLDRAPDDCRACHGDPHDGAFAGGVFATATCVDCHARTQFRPHGFTVEQHARTRMPLEGRHASAACDACHPSDTPGTSDTPAAPRRFAGLSTSCADCHADAHAAFFADADGRTDCARCHAPHGFAALREPGFDHARDVRFPIRGAHAVAGCESCHPRAAEPDAQGRCFGRVAAQFGTFRGCVTCHADPHDGGFDRPGLPAELDGRRDCARCHVETSFRHFETPFDHGRWTGFALRSAHARARCSACHATRLEPDPRGRTWEPARGTRCADCHADPHAGQFTTEGRTECARCHDDAGPFRALIFDHDRDARFALGEQHRGVACAKCHQPQRIGEHEVVRWRPLPTDCAACHGKNDDPLRRAQRRSR